MCDIIPHRMKCTEAFDHSSRNQSIDPILQNQALDFFSVRLG